MGFKTLQLGETAEPRPLTNSLPQAAENIPRGTLSLVVDGNVTTATVALQADNHRVCVPVESVDNSGGSAGDTNISVVYPKTIVALLTKTILKPGDYVKVSATAGAVDEFVDGTDNKDLMVGAYRGKEGAIFARAGTTPFKETLSAGDVPEQDAAVDDIVWVELLD